VLEPAHTARSDCKGVLGQAGCSISAFMTAGTTRVKVGCHSDNACSMAAGSKRGIKATQAPAHKAGKVWMHIPPT
jgi:hypothetical protein